MSNLIGTHVIKVAVLVTTGFGPKDLSRVLDDALVDVDEVLQFVVEGCGVERIEDATEQSLMAATVDSALEQLE
jgi:hypothetical protein